MSEFPKGDAREQLWTPNRGVELHEEYPVPDIEDLVNRWAEYAGEGEFVEAPPVYGVTRMPADDEVPKAYASIDVDEVVRNTRVALRMVEGFPPDDVLETGAYHERMSFKESVSTDITSVLQVLMTNNLIPPTEDIDKTADILRDWRENGVYVFANTSTLPGCELGTIDFFEEHLEDCFDGILFPRNHDGSLPLTKGKAARQLVDAIHMQDGELTAIHLDDGYHHNIGFREAFYDAEHITTATFAPEYPSVYDVDEESIISLTPYEAFQAADEFLKERVL